MDFKPSSRRELLKSGALAVGAAAAGASVSKTTLAQTPAPALPSYAVNEAPQSRSAPTWSPTVSALIT